MKTMKLIAMLASVVLVLSACGGGGGMVPAMPETPAAVPVMVAGAESVSESERVAGAESVSEPERMAGPEAASEPGRVAGPEPEPASAAEPEREPVPEHNRLVLPGFAAPDVDEAMFRLAHEPYNARGASHAGGGLATASLALQAGAYALYMAERSEAYWSCPVLVDT